MEDETDRYRKEFTGPSIKRRDIEFIQEIGHGSFGIVWQALVYNHLTAVKELNEEHEEDIENLRKEAQIMSSVNNQNVCRFLGACIEKNEFLLVTELCERALDSIIRSGSYIRVPYFERLEIVRQIAQGMNWLHKCNIIHNDLKPENVLLGKDGYYKVTDFGFAQLQTKKRNEVDSPIGGSPRYMSPERLADYLTFNNATDVYSFAILSWEVIQGKTSFPLHKDKKIFTKAVTEGERPAPDVSDPRMQKILTEAWSHDPKKRPDFNGLTEQITQVKIHQAIEDEKGREFWTENFSQGQSYVPQEVDWEDFKKVFFRQFNSNFTPKDEERLQMILCPEKKKVPVSRFGLLCDTCNIMTELGLQLLLRIDGKKWFFGTFDQQESNKALQSKTPGTFLVRFSRAENKFVVSRVIKDQSVIHTRIDKKDGKLSLPGSHDLYSTIEELVEKEMKSGKLLLPLPRFASVREVGAVAPKTRYSDGISLTDASRKNIFRLNEELTPLSSGRAPVEVLVRLEALFGSYLKEVVTEDMKYSNEDKTFWVGQIAKYIELLKVHIQHHKEGDPFTPGCPICALIQNEIGADNLA